ncbi:solute carrier family 45 member 3 [Protopterus annectens]|uniref:solute carrier family 45 member 3 n=1 Tax=Protopterus annectens TaxID=7888 RepID=UPI001CF984F9|nr:solute carrier family 45 member 3 [Protopterus annectens]XP_043932762.1 solute carrier family 45 member 3 [Protopterus annectens]XP_043932763.1 solute carrier family 45 member 3 [Protopterus annectens]
MLTSTSRNLKGTAKCTGRTSWPTAENSRRPSTSMASKPWVSTLFHSRRAQLLLVNSLTFGLEVCLAAGITYVPPLLLEAGVEERFMTMVLGIGAVLGLIFVPLIGSLSDRWTSSFGRRRPFIWTLCLGVLIGLFIIPHAGRLSAVFFDDRHSIKIAFLILGICFLDFCGQVCFTPLEALLSDLFHDAENCRQAFAMYSLMVSFGGCVGYLLPAINWNKSFLSSYLGGQEECLFTLLIIIFLCCVLATVFVSEQVVVQTEVLQDPVIREQLRPSLRMGCYSSFSNFLLYFKRVFCSPRDCCTLFTRLKNIFYRVPKVIRQLFVAELCSWMAVMTLILFYTDFIGEGLYQGVPSSEPGSEARLRYDEGIRMGSLGLFLQSATSIFFSTVMDHMVKLFGSRAVYIGSITLFTLAALIMCISHSVIVVTIAVALTGFTFANLQILPYTLASLYHKEKQVFFCKFKGAANEEIAQTEKKLALQNGHLLNPKQLYQNGHVGKQPSPSGMASVPSFCISTPDEALFTTECKDYDSSVPSRGICFDLAILDSAFLLSQVVPSLFMGMLVQFTQSVVAYVASAAIFGLVAIYFSTKIIYDKSDMDRYLA